MRTPCRRHNQDTLLETVLTKPHELPFTSGAAPCGRKRQHKLRQHLLNKHELLETENARLSILLASQEKEIASMRRRIAQAESA